MSDIYNVTEGNNLLTLGIVIKPIDRTTKKVKVRIPAIHGPLESDGKPYWVKEDDLPYASINYPLGLNHNDFQLVPGTIVYIEFIANDLSYPIVVGWAGGVKLSGQILQGQQE